MTTLNFDAYFVRYELSTFLVFSKNRIFLHIHTYVVYRMCICIFENILPKYEVDPANIFREIGVVVNNL